MKPMLQNPLLILGLLALLAASAGAQTTNYHDGFELGWGDWFSDNGVWEVGVPTSGPPTNSLGRRAFAGTNCAATVLGGNYPQFTSSRLISPDQFLPSLNPGEQLQLRFWHWYSQADGVGSVQISIWSNNTWGAWVTLATPASGGVTSGAWTPVQVDLTPFAEQKVRLGFLHTSGFNVSSGWYIDEVMIWQGVPTFSNPETFELGWRDWYAENGVWEIGKPTSGPGAAHEGTNCAATILAGNYPQFTSSRLISPDQILPTVSGNEQVQLRFWHWYSQADGTGYVQLSVWSNNTWGAWVTLAAPASGGVTGGVWTPVQVDLSAFAGQRVRLGFLHTSAFNVSSGWYIDEVTVWKGVPTFSNPETFELGWRDWYAENGVWEIGKPTSGPGAAHEGTNCAATILAGNYPQFTSSRLISQPLTIPPFECNPRLRFWHWYAYADGDGSVQVSVWSNNTWGAWQTLATPATGGTSSGVWTPVQVDLTTLAGQKVRLAFAHTSAFNVSAGWYIDEVRLLHDFGLSLLASPVVRTQTTACFPIGIAASSPAATVSFTLQAPPGNLTAPTLTTSGCWTGTVTPQADSRWLFTLQNSCPTTLLGVQTIGTVCFDVVSARSSFVPMAISDLAVTNLDATLPPVHAFGGRAVTIATEPLLEASLDANGRRMLTTFGKPDTAYQIRYATNLSAASPWTIGWTNVVPSAMQLSAPLAGSFSNTPKLYLRATGGP